jgi:hypothetical protein
MGKGGKMAKADATRIQSMLPRLATIKVLLKRAQSVADSNES